MQQALTDATAGALPGLPVVVVELAGAGELSVLRQCWEVGSDLCPAMIYDAWQAVNALLAPPAA